MTKRQSLVRFMLCLVLQVCGLSALGARLAYLHVGPHDQQRARVEASRRWKSEINVERGRIFDRRGDENILALDLAVKDVCVNPQFLVTNDWVIPVAIQLGEALDLDIDELAVKLNRHDRLYARVKSNVQMEDVRALKELDVPGVFFRDQTVRYYPHHDFMCHVLGFVNLEGAGCTGVELGFDRFLRGSPGVMESSKDARQRELYWKRAAYIPAIEGGDAYLTTDQHLQYIVEQALDEAYKKHHAKGACAIVQRVRTGEILAMASRPSFDLNEFRHASQDVLLNRTVGMVYEPGSTMKAIIFSAALNEGTVTPETVIDCENGAWMHRKRLLRDYHPYSKLTVADGLKKSSNILSGKLTLTMSEQRFHDYMTAFGIGQKSGIDLPGEEVGILHPVKRWSPISGSRMAIGQGVAVTPLQMLNVYCAIANDGKLMRPYLVDRVVAKDGTVLEKHEPEVLGQPVSSETAQTMRRLLARVTEKGGTGRRARVDGFSVCGKTGTAQKPEAGGYSDVNHMASFVGFLPAENPEIGIIVVVDEPQPIHTGGVVAAPVFQAIASQAVRYLDVPPGGVDMIAQR